MMREKRKESEATSVRPNTIETIIGENTEFEGTLKAATTLRVDGTFKGDIISQNTVIVGETGNIIGNIQAVNIFISGKIDGKIKISENTEFANTGYLKGEIDTNKLIVAEGAAFDGSCHMKDPVIKKKAEEQPVQQTKNETNK